MGHIGLYAQFSNKIKPATLSLSKYIFFLQNKNIIGLNIYDKNNT